MPVRLIGVGIGTKHFCEIADAMEVGDRFGDFAVLHVAVAIDEEEIFPCLPLARARFDLRHVDLVFSKRSKRIMERTDLMRHADHEACPVVTGRRTALPSEDKEACRITAKA